MKLADLRKLSVRKNLRIRFPLPNGMECVVTEHGVAQVPGLKGVPDFNLEQELASITEFVLEPADEDKKRDRPRRTGFAYGFGRKYGQRARRRGLGASDSRRKLRPA